MHLDKYPVTVGETCMVYEFISKGSKGDVPKLIVYNNTSIQNVYNLGFGDKDYSTGSINDIVITNNGDSSKVLATVADTLYAFTDIFPDAMIYATGSSKSRTRLYRMGISNNLKMIENDFHVFGFVNDGWQVFEKQVDYESFLVTRKKK